MGDEEPEGRPAAGGRDPFIVQLEWIKSHYSSWKELAETSGKVSERTLLGWANGNFPKSNSSPAVSAFDRWARATFPAYPDAAGVPALTETSGRRRVSPGGAVLPVAPTEAPFEAGHGPRQRRPRPWELRVGRRRRSRTRAVLELVAAGVVTVALVAAVVAWARSGDATPTTGPGDHSTPAPADVTASPPTGPVGASRPETTGTIGAKTFGDPFQLDDPKLPIPPETTVDVRCRLYAPSVGSVQPDGYWYLVLTSPWTGRWAPANSFLNGDRPGGPTEHNTDFDVPECA